MTVIGENFATSCEIQLLRKPGRRPLCQIHRYPRFRRRCGQHCAYRKLELRLRNCRPTVLVDFSTSFVDKPGQRSRLSSRRCSISLTCLKNMFGRRPPCEAGVCSCTLRAVNKQSSTRMRAGPGKSRPRRAAPRSGCSPVQPKSEGLDCCSHMPLQLALLTDLKFNVARIIWCTPRNEDLENRFERFSQLFHFVWLATWLSDGKARFFFFFFFFDLREVVVVQQGSRLRWCWEFARCRSSSIRRTCCLMSPR